MINAECVNNQPVGSNQLACFDSVTAVDAGNNINSDSIFSVSDIVSDSYQDLTSWNILNDLTADYFIPG